MVIVMSFLKVHFMYVGTIDEAFEKAEKIMKKQFHLDIITPTSIESFEQVDYIRIPSIDGLIGVQAKHAKAMVGLDTGEVRITLNKKHLFYSTSGGFADIAEGVQLLLETAEKAETIDVNRANDAAERAKNHLKNPKLI